MRIPRVHHPAPLASEKRTALTAEAAKHLLIVLRLKPVGAFIIFDSSGLEYDARLERPEGRDEAWATLSGARTPAVESPLHVTLVQGVSRGERMDYTVQKAVELGVAAIVPVLTERSVVKQDADKAEARREHWQAVAIGACEQSGRVRVPGSQATPEAGRFPGSPGSGGPETSAGPPGRCYGRCPAQTRGRQGIATGGARGRLERERDQPRDAGRLHGPQARPAYPAHRDGSFSGSKPSTIPVGRFGMIPLLASTP